MKLSYKILIVALLIGGGVWFALKQNEVYQAKLTSSPQGTVLPISATDGALSPDGALAWQAAIHFLTWYKSHLQEANKIALINQSEREP